MDDKLKAARNRLAAACTERDAAYKAIEDAPDDIVQDELDALNTAFDDAQASVERCNADVGRCEAIMRSVKNTPTFVAPVEETETSTEVVVRHARPKGSTQEERTYRQRGTASFFGDILSGNDPAAAERLNRHAVESEVELRDISTTATAGGGFTPPKYLQDMYADVARPGREFADALTKSPNPNAASISIPRITTAATTAVQTSNNASVNEVDLVEGPITASAVTIAGLQDVSQQLLDFSQPGIDEIVFRQLQASYDQQLDSQLLTGSGSSGQHAGLRGTSSPNTVTYTDASPTGGELAAQIYNALAQVRNTRYLPANLIVMSPLRAYWLASQRDSSHPLLQLAANPSGQNNGFQDNGYAYSFAGIPVIIDANIGTTYGAGTNQDEIYVLRTDDMYFAEGPARVETFRETLSGTLTVRLRFYAYSWFTSARYNKSLAIISGTGLTAPVFA